MPFLQRMAPVLGRLNNCTWPAKDTEVFTEHFQNIQIYETSYFSRFPQKRLVQKTVDRVNFMLKMAPIPFIM